MLTKSDQSGASKLVVMLLLAFSLFAISVKSIRAQAVSQSNSVEGHSFPREMPKKTEDRSTSSGSKKPATTEEKLSALQQMLEQQNERLDRLQQTIAEQQETIRLLVSKTNMEETHPLPPGGTDLMGPIVVLG